MPKKIAEKLTRKLAQQPPATATLTAPAVPAVDAPFIATLLEKKRGDGFKKFRSGI
jgi:hypothetical protein